MNRLNINLGDNSYRITIGRDLPVSHFTEAIAGRTAVCLVDENVARLHGERMDTLFPLIPRLIIPSGEGSKRLELLGELATTVMDMKLARDGLLIAVGGGVTGDLTGFLAATYQRGIPFIQVPTTVLAQVDASVGGKVAVNLPGAKNILGAFHQPQAVLMEMSFLETLPPREVAAGLVEVIKMGAILDPDLLADLETAGEQVLQVNSDPLQRAILRSCELKGEIVARDEKESGPRQLLNFGHTLAHALEAAPGEDPFLHGEAVAVGMLYALLLGNRCGITPPELYPRLKTILSNLGLRVTIPADIPIERLRQIMNRDKKCQGGEVTFVLLRDWGRGEYGIKVTEEHLISTMEQMMGES